jgi:hypothetical protein
MTGICRCCGSERPLAFGPWCAWCVLIGPRKRACKTDDCDNPAEHTSGYCAECHDRAGERQDERTAEERY